MPKLLRFARFPLVGLVLAITLAVSGCGSHAGTTVSAPPAGPTVSQTAGPGACPTKTTETLAKTRFATDAAIAAGVFHRYIWKAYNDGKFRSGAKSRIVNYVKAAVAVAAIVHFVNLARGQVYNSPLLCKYLGYPLTTARTAFTTLLSKFKTRQDVSSDIRSDNGLLTALHGQAARDGAGFGETPVTVRGA
jgi:hypothetical protein